MSKKAAVIFILFVLVAFSLMSYQLYRTQRACLELQKVNDSLVLYIWMKQHGKVPLPVPRTRPKVELKGLVWI